MVIESRHVNVWIDRPAGEVYDYAVQPQSLSAWAAGLVSSVERVDGQWVADSPLGRVAVEFAPRNDFGVLDHDVVLPSGQIVTNPVRVIAGDGGCEVDFTVRRQPGTTDDAFDADEAAVRADLKRLKQILEAL